MHYKVLAVSQGFCQDFVNDLKVMHDLGKHAEQWK